MSPQDEPPINLYAAPEAPLGAPVTSSNIDLAAMEMTRRTYLGHETGVKSVGSLQILGGVLLGLGMLVSVFAPAQPMSGPQRSIVIAIYVTFAAFFLAIGFGLTKLQTQARWVETAIVGLLLLRSARSLFMGMFSARNANDSLVVILAAGTVVLSIFGYILYLLLSAKGSVVFSRDYKDVIKATPHIKFKTSPLAKAVAVLFFLGIVSVILLALFWSG